MIINKVAGFVPVSDVEYFPAAYIAHTLAQAMRGRLPPTKVDGLMGPLIEIIIRAILRKCVELAPEVESGMVVIAFQEAIAID